MTRLLVLVTSTTTPSPSLPAKTPNPDSVTPGLLGFLVVFVLAVVVWLLMRNLTGRLRRMRFREEQRLADEARQQGARAPKRPDEPRP